MWVAFFLFSISQSYCAVVIKVILHVELNDFIMELEPMWLLVKWYVWKEQIIRTQRGRIIEDRRFSNSRNDCEVTEKNISICWLSSAPGLEVLCILGGGWAGLGLTFLFYIQKFNVIIPPPPSSLTFLEDASWFSWFFNRDFMGTIIGCTVDDSKHLEVR